MSVNGAKRAGGGGRQPRGPKGKKKRPGWMSKRRAGRTKPASPPAQAKGPKPSEVLGRLVNGAQEIAQGESDYRIIDVAVSLVEQFEMLTRSNPESVAHIYSGPVEGKGDAARQQSAVRALKKIISDLQGARESVQQRRYAEAHVMFDRAFTAIAGFEPTLAPQGIFIRLAAAQAHLIQASRGTLQEKMRHYVSAITIASDASRHVMEEGISRAVTHPNSDDDIFSTLNNAMVATDVIAREVERRLVHHIKNDGEGVGSALDRALFDEFGSLDVETIDYADEGDIHRNMVVGHFSNYLAGTRGGVWLLAWKEAAAGSLRWIALRSAADALAMTPVDGAPYWERAMAGEIDEREFIQLVRGGLTRYYGSDVARETISRINLIFQETADTYQEIDNILRRDDTPQEFRSAFLAVGHAHTRLILFSERSPEIMRLHRFFVSGMGGEPDDEWTPLPARTVTENAMRVPRDRRVYNSNPVIRRLNGLGYAYGQLPQESGVRRELAGAHGAILAALDNRGALTDSAAQSLSTARMRLSEARRIAGRKANGHEREVVRAADRTEALVNDLEKVPEPGVVRRTVRRLPHAMPTLAQSLLFYEEGNAGNTIWPLSRDLDNEQALFSFDSIVRTEEWPAVAMSHGLEGMIPDAFINSSYDLPGWEEVDSWVLRSGLSARPEGRFLRNYALRRAKNRIDELSGADFPPYVMDSNGLSAFMLLRRAIAWASGYELTDIPFQELSLEHIYETLFRGLELGLDPLELWEVGYAMPAAYLNNETSVNARNIDALIDRLHVMSGPNTYAEMVMRAKHLNDPLQKLIFVARHGMSHVERGDAKEGFELYRQAVRELNVFRHRKPDMPAALLDGLQQRLGGLYANAKGNGVGEEAWPIVSAFELQGHRQQAVSSGWLTPSLAGMNMMTPHPVGK